MSTPTEQQLRELFAVDAARAPDAGGLAGLALRKVRHRRRVRRNAAAGLIAAVVVLGGSAALWGPLGSDSSPAAAPTEAGEPPGDAAGDCSYSVRFEGTLFVGVVVVPLPAEPVEPLGEAEVGSCNDTGPPPSGVDIEEELERVTVSAYPGYDPRQVLAIPEPQGGVLALVSAELPRELWLQITAGLQAAAGVE